MLTLVIPVYRNEESLPALLLAVQGLNRQLEGAMETVFVVDGSPDRRYEILRTTLSHSGFTSRLVLLSRNFGSFAAIRTGLKIGRGERFAVMAADLQEPPEMVLEMNRVLMFEPIDVVVGVRLPNYSGVFIGATLFQTFRPVAWMCLAAIGLFVTPY